MISWIANLQKKTTTVEVYLKGVKQPANSGSLQ